MKQEVKSTSFEQDYNNKNTPKDSRHSISSLAVYEYLDNKTIITKSPVSGRHYLFTKSRKTYVIDDEDIGYLKTFVSLKKITSTAL